MSNTAYRKQREKTQQADVQHRKFMKFLQHALGLVSVDQVSGVITYMDRKKLKELTDRYEAAQNLN